MSLSKSLKWRVDMKNHSFNEDWTGKYADITPSFTNSKPLCIICNELIAVATESPLHKAYKPYPHRKTATLNSGYSHASIIINEFNLTTEGNKCISGSPGSLQTLQTIQPNQPMYHCLGRACPASCT